jgi:hypothetical protein
MERSNEDGLGVATWGLLTLRFLIELVLFVAPVVIAVRALGGFVGFAVGVAAAAVVIVLWGVLLSPRRRVDPALSVRVAIEVLLVLAVAWGFAVTGLVTAALALVVAEVVTVGGLWLLGLPPGSDVGDPSRT